MEIVSLRLDTFILYSVFSVTDGYCEFVTAAACHTVLFIG